MGAGLGGRGLGLAGKLVRRKSSSWNYYSTSQFLDFLDGTEMTPLVVIGGDYGRVCRHSHDIVTFCTYGEMHIFTVPVIFLCSPPFAHFL